MQRKKKLSDKIKKSMLNAGSQIDEKGYFLYYKNQRLDYNIPKFLYKLFCKSGLKNNKSEKSVYYEGSFDLEIILLAIKFYEKFNFDEKFEKNYSRTDIDFFKRFGAHLYNFASEINLPSLKNFTSQYLTGGDRKNHQPADTKIEDDIIIFGEQNYKHFYKAKIPELPEVPKFDNFFSNLDHLLNEYHNIENQIKDLNNKYNGVDLANPNVSRPKIIVRKVAPIASRNRMGFIKKAQSSSSFSSSDSSSSSSSSDSDSDSDSD
ncbi:hypothetical protein TRFO_40908 [Tritrichomonas foetus]|uniref:Uncharacterized protein n=1 Tax=Tritrichomonas foetus TaxID=1144522 RepID=A0A1J4J5R3_9EUKA|nr:hypothetical protein TRFO_40908 [Tritrichomonas foetus]|eukprot:OHS92789.1 hypothetical protein TRFO_40908 [Tritrichomonas foetus]